MRRAVVIVTLLAACALFATPAAAQTDNGWFANVGVGPAFGTFGSTAAADVSGGFKFTDHIQLAGEFGILPHAPFDKVGSIAPPVSPLVSPSDMHVNAYHLNANLFVRPSPWGRLAPYATAGFGAFTGSTVASAETGDSRIVQYERDTNPAANFGVGATYRLTDWLGVNADYRHFIVDGVNGDTEHVNRVTTGVSLFVRPPFAKK
jgi:hypothetical protein